MKKISLYTIVLSLISVGNVYADVNWTLGTSGELQDSTGKTVITANCADGVCDLTKVIDEAIDEKLTLTGDVAVTDITEVNLYGYKGKYLSDTDAIKSPVYVTGSYTNVTDGINLDMNIYGDINNSGDYTDGTGVLTFNDFILDGSLSYEGSIVTDHERNEVYAFYLEDSNIGEDLSIKGSFEVVAYDDRDIGILLYNSIIDNNINIEGDIKTIGHNPASGNSAFGIFGHTLTVNGDHNINVDFDIQSNKSLSYGLYYWTKINFNGSYNYTGDMNLYSEKGGFVGINFDDANTQGMNFDTNIVGKGVLGGFGFHMRNSTMTGDLNIDGTMDLYAPYVSGVVVRDATINGDINIGSDMYLISEGDSGYSNAIYLRGASVLNGDLNIASVIESFKPSETVSSAGVYVANTASLNGDINVTGEIYADKGITVAPTASMTGKINNAGIIEGLDGPAIDYYGSDNELTYTGDGELISSTYQFEMADGDDTLNIINAKIDNISVNSAETLNITDSTMNLTLNADTKDSSLMQITGTTSLNFTNTTLNINADYATITSYEGGEYFVIAEADTISSDLSELTLNINNYDADGTISIYNDGSGDQLIYTFAEAPVFDDDSGAINPGQGAQVDLTSSGVFQSSVTSAAAVSAAVLDVVQGRQMARKYDDILSENSQLASLDAVIMSDAGNILGIDEEKKNGVWMQLTSKKDSYDGAVKSGNNGLSSTGYDSDSFGITVGYDQKLSKELLAGVSLTYSIGEAEGSSNSFETDMDSLQLSFYGSYLMDDRTFVDAIVGYGIGSYDQKRNTGSDIAKADYDSTQLSLAATVGKVYVHGDRMLLTPFVKGSYINVKQDAYDETGSTANLSVESVSFDSFQASLGMDFGYVFQLDNYGTIMPTAKIELAREMADNAFAIDSTVRGTGLAGANYTSPDMGRSILRMGAGVTYLNEKGHEISFDYENESRDNFDSNTLYLKGKYMF
ncbi:MAG: autotransporter outer membrane beta-barrel domain-containing protein [Alphaproteobacteria bacterium]|jgi:hypothetical protein|nr:autotransporter outer membrane beta-barrel domain-containing protein [Alphaproteobacteria bacterium]